MTRRVGVAVTVAVGTKVSVEVGVADGASVSVGAIVCEAVAENVGAGAISLRGSPCQNWLIVWQEIPNRMSGRRRRVFFLIEMYRVDLDPFFNLCPPISI